MIKLTDWIPLMRYTYLHFLRRSIAAASLCLLLSIHAYVFAETPTRPADISWKAAKMDSAIVGRIDKAVAASIEKGDMSGCVVLIGRGGGVVFEKAYGNRR